MGRVALPKYKCPRCTYETKRRAAIERHFNDLVKPCPTIELDIELTQTIKDKVLNFRRYHHKKEETVTQMINSNNTIINYVSNNIDAKFKLERITSYHNKEITDFETHVDELYEKDSRRFLENKYKGIVHLKQEHLLTAIDNVTRSKKEDCTDINVMYNEKYGRYYVNISGRWEPYLRDHFIKYLVDTLAKSYLESYEIYLIRKLELSQKGISMMDKSQIKTSLENYYKFIYVFEVTPFVRNKSDADVLTNDNDEEVEFTDIAGHRIVDKYNALYERMREEVTETQAKNTIKLVSDVVKSNSRLNMDELNKRVIAVLNIDEDFKNQIFTSNRNSIEE